MSISSTPKGTYGSISNSTTHTSSSISLSAGDLLFVGTASGVSVSSVVWNSNTLTSAPSTNGILWYLPNVSGGSGTVVVTLSSSSFCAFAMRAVSGVEVSSPIDQTASATGLSSNPSSGTTSTTSNPNELFIGCISYPVGVPFLSSAFDNSYSLGQSAQSSGISICGVDEALFQASSTQTTTLSRTDGTPNSWAASVITLLPLSAVTVSISGQSITTHVNTLGSSNSVSAYGQSVSASLSTVTSGFSVPVSGVEVVGAIHSVNSIIDGSNVTVGITGQDIISLYQSAVGIGGIFIPAPCGGTSTYTVPSTSTFPITVPYGLSLDDSIAAGSTYRLDFAMPNLPHAEYISQVKYSAYKTPASILFGEQHDLFGSIYVDPLIGQELGSNITGMNIQNTATPVNTNSGRAFTYNMINNIGGTFSIYLNNPYNSTPGDTGDATVNSFTFYITTQNCDTPGWSATAFDGVVTFAVINPGDDNKEITTYQHRSMKSVSGSPGLGWSDGAMAVKGCVGAATAFHTLGGVGVNHLQNAGLCQLSYSQNNIPGFLRNSRHMGQDGTWEDATRPLLITFDPQSGSDTYASGSDDTEVYKAGSGGLQITPHLEGDTWLSTTNGTFLSNNSQWVGNGYVSISSTGSTFPFYDSIWSIFTPKQIGTGIVGTSGWINTGLGAGLLCRGLVRLHSGTLVTLLYDQHSYRTWSANSRDNGRTWTKGAAYISTIPSLEVPPALTFLGDTVVACWADSDAQPYFTLSHDCGVTWI